MSCGTGLAARDLVPLWSWLANRGRCRHCGAGIAAFYPLVELAAAALGGTSLGLLDPPASWLAAVLGWWLLALALIDLRSWLLPDVLTLPLIGTGLAVAAAGLLPGMTLRDAGLGAGAGYLALAGVSWIYRRWRGREGLGLGDAKLLAAAGAWLGVERLPWVLLLAALLGLGFALARSQPIRADTAVPFGPPLALAFWALFVLVGSG